jgi:hypothetical protein
MREMFWEKIVNLPKKANRDKQDEQTVQRLLAGVRELPGISF